MHFFGTFGIVMFLVGLIVFSYITGNKIFYILNSLPAKNIAEMSGFYIALTAMIIGVQLFMAGFIGDLVSRNSYDRNNYQIDQETANR